MNRLLYVCVFLLSCCRMAIDAQNSGKIVLETLLDEMINFDNTTLFPEYTSLQVSSYDRRSISPDALNWWANDDGSGFVRTDNTTGRTEKVLFEDFNPGVITRIWITTLNKKATLRFYFNGNKEPDWIVPAYDLVRFGIPLGNGLCQPHTSYNPVETEKGGSTLYLPIPYAQSCKVTLEEPGQQLSVPRYYHINYQRYPTDTEIETFSKEVASRAAGKIAYVDSVLQHPPTFNQGTEISERNVLAHGDQMILNLPIGNNAVRSIHFEVEITTPGKYEQVMRELIFETNFDSKQTSRLPLSDFSGGGMGAVPVRSWYLDADGNGKITSRWVMPYKENGMVSIANFSDEEINLSVTVHVAPYEWMNNSLYFHSSWKQELGIPLVVCNNPDNGFDWSFAKLDGKGVYRGDLLSLYNYSERWYGEGDEKIWVDDDVFPSHFGTGTEDYYNSSWAPVIPFHTPFGGAPRADKPSSKGYNTFLRTRNLDAIPFNHTFNFFIEMLSWEVGTVDYSTTVFWYGDYTATAVGVSEPEDVKYLLPGSDVYKIRPCIELENYPIAGKSAAFEVVVQEMSPFPAGKWSGGYQLLLKQGKPGDYVTFRFKNLKKEKQKLLLYLTKATDFGQFCFYINGQLSPVTVDGYESFVTASGPVNIGEVMPDNDGAIELKIVISGTNPRTQGLRYLLGLDCIQIQSVQAISSLSPTRIDNISVKRTGDSITIVGENYINILSLYNIQGVLMARIEDSSSLQINGLSHGIYFLEVTFTEHDEKVYKKLFI